MAKKKILTVGLRLATDATHADFTSKISLLDWDIIIFRPDIDKLTNSYDSHKGKPSLDDSASFLLKEACEHWRRELKQAVEHGKTVIVFLSPLTKVYIETGEKRHSGTGRNQNTTTVVRLFSNYEALPLDISPISSNGSAIKVSSETIAPYWRSFGSRSAYAVILPSDFPGVCLVTKSGDLPVGAIARTDAGAGSMILLPDMDFTHDEFCDEAEDDDEDEDEDEELVWTAEGKQFSSDIIQAIIAIDASLRLETAVSIEPNWANTSQYELDEEKLLRSELLVVEANLEAVQRKKEDLQASLSEVGKIRRLLYENGKPLEIAIIAALNILGFRAVSYKEGSSEFDVVFECDEGRLIGEAEGKDSKAINVDKLRQLMMNIQEDLQRDEVESPAKGVLLGNGYRLTPPLKREPQFTQKCLTAALASGTALLPTSELYAATHYLLNAKSDEEYAALCRDRILNTSGLVKLPTPPPREIAKEEREEGD